MEEGRWARACAVWRFGRPWHGGNQGRQKSGNEHVLRARSADMLNATWLDVASRLYDGDLPECRGSVPVNSTWCYWKRSKAANGQPTWKWKPPALHEFRIGEAEQGCLRGKWYLFLGDSQARTLLYSLMLLQGHSPWRTQPQSDEDVWSPASAEPGAGKSWSTDQLLPSGSCSGDLSTITRELEWNMPLASNRTCMHEHHFNGSRYSFIFLTRVRNTWGALCDLVQTFRREQRAPDALIVAHYNWPLIFDSGVGYAPDLDALLDLLLLHRAPPSAGGENETLPATCVSLQQEEEQKSSAVPPRAATVGSLLWVGQTHIASLPYHSAFKRLQGNSSWRQAQAKAYTGVEERMRARYAGAGTAPPPILRVDGWHMIDGAVITSGDTVEGHPSPRMRDHVHYHVAAYQAIVQNMLNQLCLITLASASVSRRQLSERGSGRRMHASAVADVGATGTSRHGSWLCKPPSVEPVLRSIIGGLFAEGLVPPGSAIDAGANSGEESCYYAERQPQRIVHAVEPVTGNVDWMARKYAHLTNLRVLRGGLGSEGRWVRDRKAGAKRGGQDTQVEGTMDSKLNASESDATSSLDVFRVHRVDDLFEKEWKGETLGFAHFDVEGGELSVLRGARATILRDRPLFTVEVHVHNKPNTTRALLREIRELGYVSFLVEEQCGVPVDCRNLINMPKKGLSDHFVKSATLDLATATGVLFAVTEGSIASHAYAPVCAPGGTCCPNGPGDEDRAIKRGGARAAGCCFNMCVQTWMKTLPPAEARRHAHRAFSNKAGALRSLFPMHYPKSRMPFQSISPK